MKKVAFSIHVHVFRLMPITSACFVCLLTFDFNSFRICLLLLFSRVIVVILSSNQNCDASLSIYNQHMIVQ